MFVDFLMDLFRDTRRDESEIEILCRGGMVQEESGELQ
jgi:hypothetical protein